MIEGKNENARLYTQQMTNLTGVYIDQFTYVIDSRTAGEVLSRVPKCCMDRKENERSNSIR
jgi:hypothetical protein